MSRKAGGSRTRRSEKRALLSFVPVNDGFHDGHDGLHGLHGHNGPLHGLHRPVDNQKPAKPLVPMNGAQHNYLTSIQNNVITFAIGSAGTGKTYMAAAYAAELLVKGEIQNLIITRPNIEAGKSMGYLPGDLAEKYAPYLEPILDVLYERIGRSQTDYMVKRGMIQFKPLGFLRGKSFKNSFIILDEAQNCDVSEMKLFLTRIGEDCKVIIDGDIKQCDLRNGMSGLQDAVQRLYGVRRVGVVEFTNAHCVRSGICKDILEAYEK